jgi:hypothetical protein
MSVKVGQASRRVLQEQEQQEHKDGGGHGVKVSRLCPFLAA